LFASKDLAPRILIKHLPQSSIKSKEDIEVNTVSPEPEWASQIIRYLKDGQLPEDKEEARKQGCGSVKICYLVMSSIKEALPSLCSDACPRKKSIMHSKIFMKGYVRITRGVDLWSTN